MRSARFSLLSLAPVLAMSAALNAGCASHGAADDVGSAADAIRSLQPGELLGKIMNGETKTVAYTSTPRFRAFSFAANVGDEVDVWARSTTGDAMLWLAASDNTNVAVNDDAAANTLDANIKHTITRAGQYIIALRDYGEQSAEFTVTFAKRTSCDPDEQVCDAPPPPPPVTDGIVIPDATGVVATAQYPLLVSRTQLRLGMTTVARSCPLPPDQMATATSTPYAYARIVNRGAVDKRISVWTSRPDSAVVPSFGDTVMAVYAGAGEPVTTAERLNCATGTYINNGCTSGIETACKDDWAGLVTDDNRSSVQTDRSVIVPANGTITVYFAMFLAQRSDLVVQLNVRTEP